MNLFSYVNAIIVPENFVLQFCSFAVMQFAVKGKRFWNYRLGESK